jgi:hypothetical protein
VVTVFSSRSKERHTLDMHTRRSSGILAGAVSLLGVVVMLWAVFLPFLATPCLGCLQAGGQPSVYNTWSLAQGSDARLVALTTLVLGVLVVGHLLGIRRPVTAAASLGVALAAVGLVLFEGVDARNRMFPAGGPSNVHGLSPALTLDAGFYVFLLGAVVAVVGGISMVRTSSWRPQAATHPSLSEGAGAVPTSIAP